jgi:hypothetical protein
MLAYDIFAVDFDGTLCNSNYPELGEPIQHVIDFCIRKRAEGHKLILWTCRCGKYLDYAVAWCKEHGLYFDAINENLPEVLAVFENDSRKIFATHYIDDKGINAKDVSR